VIGITKYFSQLQMELGLCSFFFFEVSKIQNSTLQKVLKNLVLYQVLCILFIIVHRGQNLNLSILLSQYYNIFFSEKLHTNRIEHCLRCVIFLELFEVFEFEFLEV
jgi:hypothetical protein